jgi:glycosyltransferase involved in cell wall biosynthesis
MKRILFITPYVPNNSAAGEKFTRTIIDKLSQHYIIDLVYFKYTKSDYYIAPNSNVNILAIIPLSSFRKVINIAQFPIVHPFFSVRFSYKLLAKLKKHVRINQVDMLILDHAQTYIYGKFFPEIKKVLIAHDIIYQRVSRKYGQFQSLICKLSEKRMITQPNSTVFTFSEKDIKLIALNYGVNARFTSCIIDSQAINTYPSKISDYYVFFGQWKREDNYKGLIWFINEVYPMLGDEISFKVIGGGMSSKHTKTLSRYNNVEILGFIDNPYQIIANAKALISPLFSGAGVKVKVLEAFACGTPVIGGEVAFEGIPLDYSKLMIFAEKKEEYVEAIKNNFNSISERKKLKKNFIDNYISYQVFDYIIEIL